MSAVAPPLPGSEAAATPVAELRQRFRQGKAELLEHFSVSRPSAPAAARLVRALARHVDATLLALWELSLIHI